MQGLLDRGSGTPKSRDDARTRRDVAAARLQGRQGGPRPLEERQPAGGDRRRPAPGVGVADARIAQLEQQIKDATVVSPTAGMVTEKIAEAGELLQAGSPLCVITDLADAWLTVYVGEPDLGRIRIGQEAEVVTDDGQSRKGRITFVASKAEFTPKNVQTRDEREKLVYKVKVGLDNRDGLFKPGMPAEARFRVAAPAGKAARDERGQLPKPWSRLEGMTRRYGKVVAAEEVTFEVRRGEMFGLIGPDGAGKTTTLRVVLGLLAPDAGTVRTCGLEPVRQSDQLSRKIGYLSQRFSLYGDLTVDENIAFFASIHGVKGWKARRDELLDLLRMTPFRGRLADRLSGGMKQKLALACTLIHTPELLVLDEPTTGVDPVSRRDFWKILAHLQRDGLTLLVTTPYLDEAERCQRIALMDRGRLLTVDAPAHLKQEAGGDDRRDPGAGRSAPATERLRQSPEVADVQSFGERLHATLKGIGRRRRAKPRPPAWPPTSRPTASRWSPPAPCCRPWKTSSSRASRPRVWTTPRRSR